MIERKKLDDPTSLRPLHTDVRSIQAAEASERIMDVQAYLDRLGVADAGNDHEDLRNLHLAHMSTVPFENIDIRARVPIHLDVERLFEKIVLRERGGFCYELNGLFAALLTELGFSVRMVEGRVFHQRKNEFGPPFDHMALLVDTAKGTFLADVGFGEIFKYPMPFTDGARVEEGTRSYSLVAQDDDLFELRRTQRDRELPVYQFTTEARALDEFKGMCSYHCTSPASHFTQRTICTRITAQGRTTLMDDRIIFSNGRARKEESIDPDDFQRVLQKHFGAVGVPEIARSRK